MARVAVLLGALIVGVSTGWLNESLLVPDSSNEVLQKIKQLNIGDGFLFKGTYHIQENQCKANFVVLNTNNADRVFLIQLRFNFEQELHQNISYAASNTNHDDKWGRYSRNLFPMELEDGLEFEVWVVLTETHYQVTINGVQMERSLENNREGVEYFTGNQLRLNNAASFTFTEAWRLTEISKY